MRRIATTPIRADINVTVHRSPLRLGRTLRRRWGVDVVLVLLIIFMLVTPRLDGVKLPTTARPAEHPEHPERLLITIAHDGALRIDGEPVPPERFAERLKDLFAKGPAREVVLKADRVLPYGEVKRALLAVRDAGFGHAGLIASQGVDVGPAPARKDAS